MVRIAPRKHRTPFHQLAHNAARRPYIYLCCKLAAITRAQQLWRAIPARRNVICPKDRNSWLTRKVGPAHPQIAKFQVAAVVHKDICRFDVTVRYARPMHIGEGTQELIHDPPGVTIFQLGFRPDQPLKVGLHELGHKEHVVELLCILRH